MLNSKIYNLKGKETGELSVPEKIFGLPWNSDLVHQVMISMRSNMRRGTADTKGRGEVRGGGKKPWKQKGTGRARHGSTRSPIWVGGGVTHGPLAEKNYDRKINRKMKSKAFYTVLSKKFKDGEVLFTEAMDIKTPKTSIAFGIIKALSAIKGFGKMMAKKKKTVSFVIAKKDQVIQKSFRNIPSVEVILASNLNIINALERKLMVFVDAENVIKTLSKQK